MSEGHRLVFVGGLHRSGTSPLARALGAHPQVSVLSGTGVVEDEGQHLQPVYPAARTYGGSGRFAHAEAAHLTEDSPLATPDAAERLLRSWEPFWDLRRPVLVEKSPPNIVMGRFLQRLFPSAALVVVVRHPVVVALSTKKWRGGWTLHRGRYETLASLVGHWVRAHEVLEQDLPHLHRVHLVRYEHLVGDTDRELQRLGGFLGLAGAVPRGGLGDGHSDRYLRGWARTASPLHPWHRQRREVEERFAEVVAGFGYDLVDPSAPPTAPLGALSRTPAR